MSEFQPSLTEFAVLGLLSEGPAHGFAISKTLSPAGEVGRVLTVRRPLVYRALDRLVGAGLVSPVHIERGTAGPDREIKRLTPAGRKKVNRWLTEPVSHIRDLRIEFQLKLLLLERSQKSPGNLIKAQQEALRPTLEALDYPTDDYLELWRQYNAAAAGAYLDQLARLELA